MQPIEGDGFVAQVRLRIGAQVDDHVVNGAADAADQLCLLVRRSLPMHPTKGTLPTGRRDAALSHVWVEVVCCELSSTECAGKRAALIMSNSRVQEIGTLDQERHEVHRG